jgi:single-strand DNA-binding protein
MNLIKNKVQIIGNLGANPEIITLKSGKKLAKMIVATNDTFKNEKGEKFEETQWHNVIAWSNKAKIAEYYLIKGKKVCIEGRLNKFIYTDKNGKKRYYTEIICQELLMLA